jgi:hypothetical protein
MSSGEVMLKQAGEALDDYVSDLLDESGAIEPEPLAETMRRAEDKGRRFYIFAVGSLNVGVPVQRAAFQAPMPTALEPVEDSSPALRYEARSEHERFLLVDTAQLLFDRPDEGPGQSLIDRGHHVVFVDGGAFALTAESHGACETIEEDAILLAGPGCRRPWLAGTVRSRNCVLIDIDGVGLLLDKYAAGAGETD